MKLSHKYLPEYSILGLCKTMKGKKARIVKATFLATVILSEALKGLFRCLLKNNKL